LQAVAQRDLEAEGFDAGAASYDIELDLPANGSSARTIRAGSLDDALTQAKGSHVDVVRVRARFPVGVYEPVGRPPDETATPPPLARKEISLGAQPQQAPIYDWDALVGRGEIEGPAVAVGEAMTCLVPPGWSLSIDEFANGVLRHGATKE
jgi:N-methylhydantoinase A/oxoprolinase/acetone carboxylase beta subunit